MKSPANKKDVQRLHGCLAALTRFLSKAAEKSLPFMKVLKSCRNKKDFVWTVEAENAFQEVKQLLKTLPTLTSPKEGETLILYLAISKEAISSVLIAERNGVQMPIYFVSKVLQLSETNYPPLHRMVYVLVHTARQSSGRLAKWDIELGEYEINFAPRNAVKGQILADFLLETNEKVEHDNKMVPQQHVWELHTDGASSEEGTGKGLVLTSSYGEEYTYALKFCFYASNNEAEYEALLFGLRIALEMGITNLRAYVDSQIVAQQVNGTFDARDTSMRQYNKKADVLSKLATLTFDHLHKRVLVEELKEKSIHEKPIMTIVEGVKETWMTPYLRYLHDGGLPIDKAEARRIRVTAPMYEVINGALHRKSYNGPLLRCLTNDESLNVVKEMHEGVCSQHSGFRTVASRIMRQGYFRPTLYRDVAEIIKICENYQRHGTVQRLPKYDLTPVSSAWSFYKWAIDIVGPFNRSTGNAKFLVVAIDFFTKWVEAKALAKITGENVKKFVWHDIVCRYGVPNEIARLGLSQTGWVDELPNVLWEHRTTPKRSTGETPFSLVYSTEAVIPAEICVPMHNGI
ncbi:uncharacterized protein [Rutidosis leptorrhynchoides]|uniref:uncharacterized protein n=1 Tax=Rutidosis leptorrhynchoides TaxID=125765 RepID=UPI003A98F8D0